MKFENAKEDILEYTMERLKDLLEWHVRIKEGGCLEGMG